MTDKKRLEEAKLMAEMLRVETRLPHDFPFDLIDWLVEQAERVQELEEENKRYREALERIKDNVPLEFKHNSEYEAKKNVIRLINIQNEVDEALEGEE